MEDRMGACVCVSHRIDKPLVPSWTQISISTTYKSPSLVHTPSHHKGVREVRLVHSDSQNGENFPEEIYIKYTVPKKGRELALVPIQAKQGMEIPTLAHWLCLSRIKTH